MLEQFGGAAIVLGTVLALAAVPWLLWVIGWAVFGKVPWGRLRWPLGLMAAALALMVGPIIIGWLMPLDLGPYQKTVDGEIHLTLTGWDRQDYGPVLSQRRQAAVLQMANPDVTDETLQLLAGMPNLREVDLNGTKVTDAGLAALAVLPKLEDLRLSRTAITDDGFRQHLLEKESLMKLDLRETEVASKTVRAWKAKREGRMALK
ncbi:MAG: hypothetical protein AB7O62_04430 [Pirellulales bacterium]